MDSRDDPEERIRELERPLADAARASEAGQQPQPPGGYPYPQYPPGPTVPPSPPPPGTWTYDGSFSGPPYGGSFGGPPPKPPSGNRTWWILGTIIVVGFLVLAGGIAAFVAHRLSDARSVISSLTTTSATVSPSTSRSRPPSTTRTRTTAPSTSPTPTRGASISVSGIGENRTIACDDNIVSVSGVSNTVVITGHCTSLTVSGVQNSITVDAADSIDASGFNNKITYHTGTPKISNSGGSNVVQRG
ncbi:DUF3060 domain-containing protein [Mycobacterium sp.]|uniref:DUF3060 domain-containing protein n=1 Tax=Mycobacterium sp. TaxID=1785 RepID=UPI0025DE3378|nr:DUF3060 domain-containing protein [Mycobacterium sp.]MBW0013686.1 DUF3060 domain-containing protein [Mycobacterium sp.]